MSSVIKTFGSTNEAYHEAKREDTVGSIFHVPSVNVVGLPHTYPVAITVAAGKFHTLEMTSDTGLYLEVAREAGWSRDQVKSAVDLAMENGYRIAYWATAYLLAAKETN